MKLRRPVRRPYAVGIAGLPATSRSMLRGRLYAATISLPQAMAGCIAGTVFEALRDGGSVIAVLSSSADDLIAALAARGLKAHDALASGRLLILRQTADANDGLVDDAARQFVDELDYLGASRHCLVVIESAERLFSARDEQAAIAQARVYRRWFDDAHATGLLLFQDTRMNGARTVLGALDGFCAGLATFRADGARFVWQTQHWLSPVGSVGLREYGVGFADNGALAILDSTGLTGAEQGLQAAPDQHRVIATRAVVDGERGVPAHWRIVADLSEMLEAADGAVAATCLIDFHGGDQLRILARAVHYLRRKSGRALRIVVRERHLRLRYNDELLLLRLGANTVVYAEVGFSRFISLVESLHGQAFVGEIPDDFDGAVQAALPPQHSGYLTPAAFCDVVRGCISQSMHIGVESTLFRLFLLPEVAHLDALRACRVKRPGDLFTADERSVWLFLYACRESDADTTLERVYREPLAQMFEGHVRYFAPSDILSAVDTLESALYGAPLADFSEQLTPVVAVTSTAATPLPSDAPHAAAAASLPELPPSSARVVVARQRQATREPLTLTTEATAP